MAKSKHTKRLSVALEDRFDFIGDGVAVGDRASLGSAIFDVEEKSTGAELEPNSKRLNRGIPIWVAV